MSGTRLGGKRAAETNKKKFGEDFYRNLGRKGGVARKEPGGFSSETVGRDGLTGSERAHIVGALGGRIGRRGYKLIRLIPEEGCGLYRDKTTGEEKKIKIEGLGEHL